MKILSKALAILTISFFSILFAIKYEVINRGDPDRFYHYAISKITSQHFAPTEIPQIVDLGWNQFFVEKEFLFHVYTGLAYKIGAENGVKIACLGLGFLILLLIYHLCRQTTSSWHGIVMTILLCTSSERFISRIFTIRPHVLGVLLCIGILWAVLEKRTKLTGFLCVLFALAYHAFYLPIIVAGAGVVASLVIFKTLKHPATVQSIKICLFAALGILVGAIINPYFPSNIMIGFQHLKIALVSTGLPISHFGMELLPLDGTTFLKILLGFIGLLFLCTIWGSYKYSTAVNAVKNDESSIAKSFYQIYTLLILCLVFLLISLHNPRGIEFLVPFTAVLVSRVSAFIPKRNFITPALCLIVFGIQSFGNKTFNFKNVKYESFLEEEAEQKAAKLAVEKIPFNPAKNKVLNCNWDVSPYVFYTRPDLKFVDVLDPSLLYAKNKDQYEARNKWRSGNLPDAWGAFKEGFKADYVFCWLGRASKSLATDPHFELLYPKGLEETSTAKFEVYELKESRFEEFVTAYSHSKDMKRIDMNQRELPTLPLVQEVPWPPKDYTGKGKPVFIDLYAATNFKSAESGAGIDSNSNLANKDASANNNETQKKQLVCSEVSPTADEITRLQGASYAGLGGGPNLELWIDNQKIYATKSMNGSKQIVHTLIKLNKKLEKSSNVRVRVCGSEFFDYQGVAISFWTHEALTELCKWKWLENKDFETLPRAQQNDRSDLECIANLARK